MPSHLGRDRPTGVRSGVGHKPPRVKSVTLAGANPVIRPGGGTAVRIICSSDAYGSIGLQAGRFDGQPLDVIGWSNAGTAVIDASSVNVALTGAEWSPDEDNAIRLVWESRRLVWVETGRGGVTMPLHVVIYDDDGSPITTFVENGENKISVSDAETTNAIGALVKVIEEQTRLLKKLYDRGRNI